MRENILFGHQYNSDLYRDTIKGTALDEDFGHFQFGDQTMIGQKVSFVYVNLCSVYGFGVATM